jgi:hypothetical protein
LSIASPPLLVEHALQRTRPRLIAPELRGCLQFEQTAGDRGMRLRRFICMALNLAAFCFPLLMARRRLPSAAVTRGFGALGATCLLDGGQPTGFAQ